MAAPLPDRTLLLVADQGFGDVIQFARYIPWAAERCPDIAIACSAEMQPLLQQIARRQPQFRSAGQDAPEYAAFCALSGLPRLAGTRVENVPGADAVSARRTRNARRTGRSGWTGWCRAASPHRHDLGRPADAQQRPQPFGAARRFRAAGRCAGDRAAGIAEGAEDRQAGAY